MMVAMMTSQAVGRASTFRATLDKGKIGAIKTFEFLERDTKAWSFNILEKKKS